MSHQPNAPKSQPTSVCDVKAVGEPGPAAELAPAQGAAPAQIVVRAAQSSADVKAVVELTGACFPEECGTLFSKGGAGLTLQQWRALEEEDLTRQPWLWPSTGLAVERTAEGERVLGAIVLTFAKERDESISYWEVSKRVGCLATMHNWMYDQVLEEPLKPHECLIDFIAVSPAARGKGVGAMLMAWAQETGTAILLEREPEAVAARGPLMTLWVAADNAVAQKLYRKTGYNVTYKTDDGLCHCLMSRMLKSFLGHPVWYRMDMQLPIPEAAALVKPVPASVAIPISASCACASPSGAPAPTVATPPAAPAQEKIPAHNPQPLALQPAMPLLAKMPSAKELPVPAGSPAATASAGKADTLAPFALSSSSSPDGAAPGAAGSAVISSLSAAASDAAAALGVAALARTISSTAAAAVATVVRRTSEAEAGACNLAPAALVVRAN